mmetsp:Transcript_174318/g.558793  ORF Transcript_174318/g.558793 Transcript_174318/m.558793 type:complete len:263 (-) Transcript_174318:1253-2041(-)
MQWLQRPPTSRCHWPRKKTPATHPAMPTRLLPSSEPHALQHRHHQRRRRRPTWHREQSILPPSRPPAEGSGSAGPERWPQPASGPPMHRGPGSRCAGRGAASEDSEPDPKARRARGRRARRSHRRAPTASSASRTAHPEARRLQAANRRHKARVWRLPRERRPVLPRPSSRAPPERRPPSRPAPRSCSGICGCRSMPFRAPHPAPCAASCRRRRHRRERPAECRLANHSSLHRPRRHWKPHPRGGKVPSRSPEASAGPHPQC